MANDLEAGPNGQEQGVGTRDYKARENTEPGPEKIRLPPQGPKRTPPTDQEREKRSQAGQKTSASVIPRRESWTASPECDPGSGCRPRGNPVQAKSAPAVEEE